MANPVGPPTKYKESMLAEVENYIENYGTEEFDDIIPMESSVCVMLKIAKPTLLDWVTDGKHLELSALIQQIKVLQESALINGGLSSRYNPMFSKMILSKHGYSDKVEQTIDQTNSGDISLNIKHVT